MTKLSQTTLDDLKIKLFDKTTTAMLDVFQLVDDHSQRTQLGIGVSLLGLAIAATDFQKHHRFKDGREVDWPTAVVAVTKEAARAIVLNPLPQSSIDALDKISRC